jgi:superoxide oxidase
MMNKTVTDGARFSRLSIAVHWFSVLIVLAAFALGWARDLLEESGWDDVALMVHRQLGVTVMVLLLVRLAVRFMTKPQAEAQSFNWLDLLGTLSHLALYALLVLLPVLGWAMTNAQGHAVTLWGVLPLPELVAIDPDWADTFQEWHEQAGVALLLLVALHAAAALFHHHVLKDDVLTGMLPALHKRRSAKAPH